MTTPFDRVELGAGDGLVVVSGSAALFVTAGEGADQVVAAYVSDGEENVCLASTQGNVLAFADECIAVANRAPVQSDLR